MRRVPTHILGSEVKKLSKQEVKLKKVQLRDDREDATWETLYKIRTSYPFLFKGMFLTSFSKAFICACFYHLNISYRSNLRPLGRLTMDVNMCLRHVMIDGCKWSQVVARGCMTHIRH